MIWFSKYRDLTKYISAQAQHETGNYTSQVYLQNHNMFGMSWTNGARGQIATKGIAKPEGGFYANYASDSKSISDLLKWFDYTNFPTSVTDANQYAQELQKRNYFTDSYANYANALLKWLTT